MDIVTEIIFNVALLFIMMIPGIILNKCKMISKTFGKGLSNLVLYIAQPALIFTAYLKDFDKEILINSLYVLVFSVLVHIIFSVVSLLVFKRAPEEMGRMLKFATIFSNAAFMGIPLIAAVLEDKYPGATLYASVYNITFNLFLWSLGVSICTKGKDKNLDGVDDFLEVSRLLPSKDDDEKVKDASGSPLKALIHPVTIAALVGLVFFILPINGYIPAIVTDSLDMLKSLVAPLSMTVIGIRLSEIDFRGIFKDKYMYVFLVLRHLLLPMAAVGLIKLAELVGLTVHPAVSMVIAIMASAPAATSATMFAEKFDCDALYVSRLVTVSTLLSIVTMPLIIFLV